MAPTAATSASSLPLVTAGEAVVIDQILVDRLGVPTLTERQIDEVEIVSDRL
jgi:hypothetical protein